MQVAVWRRLQEIHMEIASLEEQKSRISAAVKTLVVRAYRFVSFNEFYTYGLKNRDGMAT